MKFLYFCSRIDQLWFGWLHYRAMDCWYVRLTTHKTVCFAISIAAAAVLTFYSSLVSAQSVSVQVNDTTGVSDSLTHAKSEAERLSHSVNTSRNTIDSVRNGDYRLPAHKIYSERYLQSYRDSIKPQCDNCHPTFLGTKANNKKLDVYSGPLSQP